MWAYAHYFCIEDVDDGNMAQDCGVEVEFNQSSHGSHHDRNLIRGKLCYVGKVQEIIQVDLSFFEYVVFRCNL
jgi:hypothetical protein